MKIKYISCDGVTEIEEEVTKIEFFEALPLLDSTTEDIEIECTRSKDNIYYDPNNTIFCIYDPKKIIWIKSS